MPVYALWCDCRDCMDPRAPTNMEAHRKLMLCIAKGRIALNAEAIADKEGKHIWL
jgi:hypothetical protein